MANNTFVRGTVGNYPTVHNSQIKKGIETALHTAPNYGTNILAAAAADYAILTDDGYNTFVVADAITVTLPNALANKGRKLAFLQLGTATLTIAQNVDDANINGADADFTTINAANDRAEFISSGTEWLLVTSTIV